MDLIGAVVRTAGHVVDTFAVSTLPADKSYPAIAKGPGNQTFVTFSMWADSINRHPASTWRIWGALSAHVPIGEIGNAVGGVQIGKPSVSPNPFRGQVVISIPEEGRGTGRGKGSSSLTSTFFVRIYDASGRFVRKLSVPESPGATSQRLLWDGRDANGRALAAGVYMIKTGSTILKVVKEE